MSHAAALDDAVSERLRAIRARQDPNSPARSLLAYARLHVPEYETPWHIRLVAAKLEAVERGEIKRLMLFLPPRHGKSQLASQLFPAWYLGRDPRRQVICASYAQGLADDFGRKVRNAMSSPEHLSVFPGSGLSRDSTAAERFSTAVGGAYVAVGRGGPTTGRGANLALVDDPLKDREEADSETIREKLKSWYAEVLYTRLAPGGSVVVIETRWHQDDLAGWLLREHASQGWDVVSLPALAEKDEPNRLEGEALWPERYSRDVLLATKAQMGGAFSALYQQRPAAVEGVIFKRAWWGGYSGALPAFNRVVQSWDTAFKEGESNDYSVCTTWGETDTAYYLLHVWRERVAFPALVAAAKQLAESWSPNVVLIEDKASGQSLVQSLKTETRLPVVAVKVGTSKESRASAVTPTVEAGKVLLPAAAGWRDAYLDELSQFPAAAHDDQTDSTTMALEHMTGLSRRSSGAAWLELARESEEKRKRQEAA